MSNMSNNINEKIKKLLRLAGSDNEHESRLAMARARKLMAQYKLDIKDFDKSEKEVIEFETKLYWTPYKNSYRHTLASLISEKYCCVNYSNRYGSSSKSYITLRGYEEDVKVLNDILNYACSCVDSWFTRAKKEKYYVYNNESQNAIKNTYGDGFAKGLSDLLDEQMNCVENQEWGLVMVVPQEAKDFRNGLFKSNRVVNRVNDQSILNRGYIDGKNSKLHESLVENM